MEFEPEVSYFAIKSLLYYKFVEESHNKARVFSIVDGSLTRDVYEDYELIRKEEEQI